MSTFKKRKVVRLSTNEKATICSIVYNAELGTLDVNQNPDLENINRKLNYWTVQHLYFLSDEEIKEGDWVYNKVSKETYQFKENHVDYEKKIIATTDKSLEVVSKGINPVYEQLPQPSQSFLEKFVEEYNKGNVITEVLVEYNEPITEIPKPYKPYSEVKHLDGTLKVSKDNTITIRKVKDSWNREEVVEFAEKYARMVQEKEIQLNAYKAIHNHKWIEENL